MYLTKNYFSVLVVFLFSLLIVSCSDDDMTEESSDQETSIIDQPNALHLMASSRSSDSSDGEDDYDEGDLEEAECFDFVYPIDITFPDGTTTSVNTDEEVDDIIEMWYDDNPDASTGPVLVFPLDVTTDSLGTITVQNEEELCNIIASCYEDYFDDDFDFEDYPGEFDSDCIEIIFPIDVLLPDGTVVTVNSEDEYEDVLDDWYAADPDYQEVPQIVFPIDIVIDSIQVSVQSEEELYEVSIDCFEFGESDEYFDEFDNNCFQFVFPLIFSFPDNTTQTAASEDEVDDILDVWYAENPESEEEPHLIFPVDILIDSTQTSLTILNEQELEAVIVSCYENGYGYDDDDDDDDDDDE